MCSFFFIKSMLFAKEDDGLNVVNQYLEDGWKVKHISACAVGDNMNEGQAYIVIEKDEFIEW